MKFIQTIRFYYPPEKNIIDGSVDFYKTIKSDQPNSNDKFIRAILSFEQH